MALMTSASVSDLYARTWKVTPRVGSRSVVRMLGSSTVFSMVRLGWGIQSYHGAGHAAGYAAAGRFFAFHRFPLKALSAVDARGFSLSPAGFFLKRRGSVRR